MNQLDYDPTDQMLTSESAELAWDGDTQFGDGCEFDPGRCDWGNAVVDAYCSYHAALVPLPGECDCGHCWQCIGSDDVCCEAYDLGLPCSHHPDSAL